MRDLFTGQFLQTNSAQTPFLRFAIDLGPAVRSLPGDSRPLFIIKTATTHTPLTDCRGFGFQVQPQHQYQRHMNIRASLGEGNCK